MTRLHLWQRAGLALMCALPLVGVLTTHAAETSRTFAETGQTISGPFLSYWDAHGGLAQQGYPISSEQREVSTLDGKPYSVQYFERAVFERHPENAAPFDVLLAQLGTFRFQAKYPQGVPGQHTSTDNPRRFAETGYTVGGPFRAYWEGHGGVTQQGFPISNEFQEKSDLDGKLYTVQYFERAVFEAHPENAAPYNVLLAQLGKFRFQAKASAGPTLPAPLAKNLPANVKLDNLGPAPEPVGITDWINSGPQTLAGLRGKVVLVHFWTFGCYNCRNVQPYVEDWYARYKGSGFTVLSIHTPELSFEKDIANVRTAVRDQGVLFPVGFDPKYATWNAYNNVFWPAFYYVDKGGQIRYTHFGEGDYDGQEQVIRQLLAEPQHIR